VAQGFVGFLGLISLATTSLNLDVVEGFVCVSHFTTPRIIKMAMNMAKTRNTPPKPQSNLVLVVVLPPLEPVVLPLSMEESPETPEDPDGQSPATS
jgi:hypothetical protein